MADNDNNKRSFNIKRVSDQKAIKEVKKSEESIRKPKKKVRPIKVPSAPIPDVKMNTATAALYQQAGHSLAFLSSAMGSGLVESLDVFKSPNSGFWIEMDVPEHTITHLIWITKGKPFTNFGEQWIPIYPSGSIGKQEDVVNIKTKDWTKVSLSEILNETTLLPSRYQPTDYLEIVLPGPLGQVILKRLINLQLQALIIPSERKTLSFSEESPSGVLLMQVKAKEGKTIPAALVKSLTALPSVFIGNVWESNNNRILVDVRYRPPMPPPLMAKLVPEGETWILGAPEDGHWTIRPNGGPIEGVSLLEAETKLITKNVIPSHPVKVPEALPVQLVHRPSQRNNVDAILLDETELDWLIQLLKNRPIEESAFLFPGQGVYLLTAPGGLSAGIPLGIPMSWHGPGGFYIELGKDFYPALPISARKERFQLSEETIVAISSNHSYRFQSHQMIPAWKLWIGSVPEIKEGLSKRGKALLSQIAIITQNQSGNDFLMPPPYKINISKMDRLDLLKEAQILEIGGNLLQAAQLLEKAGFPGQAGRLYERAAAT